MKEIIIEGSKIFTAGDYEGEIMGFIEVKTLGRTKDIKEYPHLPGNLDSILDYVQELKDYYPSGTRVIWKDSGLSKERLLKTAANQMTIEKYGKTLFEEFVDDLADQGFVVELQ